MAERQIKSWITVNGKHIPIYDGESKSDAINRSIAKDNEDKKKSDIEKAKKSASEFDAKMKGEKWTAKNPESDRTANITRKDVEELTARKDALKGVKLETREITQEEIDEQKKFWGDLKKKYGSDSKSDDKPKKISSLMIFKENANQLNQAKKDGLAAKALEIHYTGSDGKVYKLYWNGTSYGDKKMSTDLAEKYSKMHGVYKAEFKKPKDW